MPLLPSARPRAALLGLAILCLGAPPLQARERTPATKVAPGAYGAAAGPAKARTRPQAGAHAKADRTPDARSGSQPEPDSTTGALPADPEVAWSSGDAATCSRGRRKFWQAGEGWVVRTITTCR
ncbi:hypothetical protein [Methylobacterium sp. A54F]